MDELEIGGKKYISSKKAARDHRYHIDYIGQLIRGGKIIGKKIGRSWYVEDLSLKNYLRMEAGLDPLQEEREVVLTTQVEAVEESVAEDRSPAPDTQDEEKVASKTPEPKDEITMENIDISDDKEDSNDSESDAISEANDVKKEGFFAPIRIPVSVAGERKAVVVPDNEPQMPVLERRVRENADFMPINLKKPLYAAKQEPIPQTSIEQEQSEEAEQSVKATPDLVEHSLHTSKAHKRAGFGKKVLVMSSLTVLVVVLGTAALVGSMLTTKIEVKENATASARLSLP